MKKTVAALVAILSISACGSFDSDLPAQEIEYARATAMLRACPLVTKIVRDSLADTKLTQGEARAIGAAYGTAYGRRYRAEIRAKAMREAGMRKTISLPPECSGSDPKGYAFLLEKWARWGIEHGD